MTAAAHFHLSLNVADLARSVAFYRTLFNRAPAKQRPDYAKFEVDDPLLVLSLEPAARGSGGALNHLGFRLPDATTLVGMQRRLEQAGIRSQREEGVECCYARQTKFWVTDPDNTLWEFYVLEGDLDHRGAGQTPEQMLPGREEAPPAPPVVWEHRLGDPVPAALPLADGSADEVRLTGTLNAALPGEDCRRLLREARRVLRDGGQVQLHNLVADRPLPGRPQLPGPAAAVQRVPPEGEPLRLLEEAGFVGLHLTRFGASPCFQIEDVQMREMMLTAAKAGGAPERSAVVLYKGPLREVTDDEGNVYRRGKRVHVSALTRDLLRRGPAAGLFVFLS
jgi:catechol 2,3-dioxygenase-like lactoylglutathione lyase family enzyme